MDSRISSLKYLAGGFFLLSNFNNLRQGRNSLIDSSRGEKWCHLGDSALLPL
jgi:hypothetical protein